MSEAARRRSLLSRARALVSAYPVPVLFILVSALAIPVSGFSAGYLAQELITRLVRNSFLVLSLIVPIIAGMGLNFGMTLGAMGGQIALILVTDWNVVGLPGLFLAMLMSVPLSVVFGYAAGRLLNRAKGREMVTGFILAFFANGLYQLVVLYGMGVVFPIRSSGLLLSRRYGVRNAINLSGIRQVLDGLVPLREVESRRVRFRIPGNGRMYLVSLPSLVGGAEEWITEFVPGGTQAAPARDDTQEEETAEETGKETPSAD